MVTKLVLVLTLITGQIPASVEVEEYVVCPLQLCFGLKCDEE